MKLLDLVNNDTSLKKNIINKITEINKITKELLEMENYKTNFFDDCNIEELMNSREKILKLLKKGDGNLKLLYSNIIEGNLNEIKEFVTKNKKYEDLSNSMIFCDMLKNKKNQILENNEAQKISLEENYEIMENTHNDYEDLFNSLKNCKYISTEQINELFRKMNYERDKELKLMSNHFLKKEDKQFIQDSNYIIRIINEKEKYLKQIELYKKLFNFLNCITKDISQELDNFYYLLKESSEDYKQLKKELKNLDYLLNINDENYIGQVMSELSIDNSREVIDFLLNQNLNDLCSIFEIEEVAEIEKMINTTILIHSIFEDVESKSESELIEHIKTFLPNKNKNDEQLKQNFIYLSDVQSLKEIVNKLK